MSKRGRSPRLELRPNLSPAREAQSSSAESQEFSTSSTNSSSEMTVEGSCVSSEAEDQQQNGRTSETKAMLLVGCPRCLMYVMLSETNPKCPKCKSTVLLDFLNEEISKKPDS